MATKDFGWSNLLVRFIGALALVFASYNPYGYSYFDWALADFPTHQFQNFTALKTLAGVILLIGWIGYIKVTQRTLGLLGIVLTIAFLGSLIWLLIEQHVISVKSTRALINVILIILSGVLAVGMSWAHIRRRISGEVVADEVDK